MKPPGENGGKCGNTEGEREGRKKCINEEIKNKTVGKIGKVLV